MENNILFKLVKEAAEENNILIYIDSMSIIKNTYFVKKGIEYAINKSKENIHKKLQHIKEEYLNEKEIEFVLDKVLKEIDKVELEKYSDLDIDLEKAKKCL